MPAKGGGGPASTLPRPHPQLTNEGKGKRERKSVRRDSPARRLILETFYIIQGKKEGGENPQRKEEGGQGTAACQPFA